MKYIKLFENKKEQQPFYLRDSDYLYISDELAHRITPTIDELKRNSNRMDWIKWQYQNQLDFFNNKKNEKGWSISTSINTNIHVEYNDMYRMNIIFKRRGNEYINEFGNFRYYIDGTSGDYKMHGKNMKRATRECNLHFMEQLYPIIKNIKDFYQKLKNKGFFDIIREELFKNPNIAKNGIPTELESEFGYLYIAYQYNL